LPTIFEHSRSRWLVARIRAASVELRHASCSRGSRRQRFSVRSDDAAERVRSAFRVLQEKAGFRDDQPRWPKGSGGSSGRWSGGAGTGGPSARTRYRTRGHHIVPRSVTGSPDINLSSQARDVFERETTGPSYGSRHGYSKVHHEYNMAVREQLIDYLRQRGLSGSMMTADDAEEFLKQVYASKDPRVQRFNLFVYRQRLLDILRRFGPIGRE
jgi:hypothetical protein